METLASKKLVLPASEVTATAEISGTCSRQHEDGWKIKGRIHENYFTWVEEFYAEHPKLGKVWGSFSKKIYTTSSKAYEHFIEHHPPDYLETDSHGSSKNFALCIHKEPDCNDLCLGTLYSVLSTDEEYLRVIDESGEDYLYPVKYFIY